MLSTEWLSAFAPVGALRQDNQWAAFGACVFFHKPPLLWVVTARHVVEKVGRQALTVLVTRSSGEGVIVVEVGKILASHGLSWVEDEVNDLAAAPMPTSADFATKAVTPQHCLRMTDIVPSMPCFTVGCPYGLHGLNPQKATPLVLDGIISGADPTNRKVYTSAPTFPGNSGGPLLAVPFDPIAGINAGRPTILFAGIMLETKLLHAPDPTSRIPPLHLGVAAPADAVLALFDSDPAQAISTRLEALRPSPSTAPPSAQ
ncbi:MAG TPA: serine protease [Gemmataceae bacterium]|nr:serine protease [Gemmataceae bacterium]